MAHIRCTVWLDMHRLADCGQVGSPWHHRRHRTVFTRVQHLLKSGVPSVNALAQDADVTRRTASHGCYETRIATKHSVVHAIDRP